MEDMGGHARQVQRGTTRLRTTYTVKRRQKDFCPAAVFCIAGCWCLFIEFRPVCPRQEFFDVVLVIKYLAVKTVERNLPLFRGSPEASFGICPASLKSCASVMMNRLPISDGPAFLTSRSPFQGNAALREEQSYRLVCPCVYSVTQCRHSFRDNG